MIYPNRYEKEPRKRKAYCEACDLIAVYGAERKDFKYYLLQINREEMKEIWDFALRDMNGESTIDIVHTWKGKKRNRRRGKK